MISRHEWRRIGREMTRSPIALVVGGIGTFFIAVEFLVFNLSDAREMGSEIDGSVMLIGAIPLFGAAVWLSYQILRAWLRRTRLRKSLSEVLAAHGENVTDVADIGDEEFPEIPVWVTQTTMYCAGQNEVVPLPIEQMAWAYAENFSFRPYFQLVIWDRNALGTVLPVRKWAVAESLDRLRKAAPWLPIGFNRVMKESWNADHQDFISMIDAHRQAGMPFEVSWAGSGLARVYSRVRKGGAEDVVARQERKQAQENLKALELWNNGKG